MIILTILGLMILSGIIGLIISGIICLYLVMVFSVEPETLEKFDIVIFVGFFSCIISNMVMIAWILGYGR